MKLVDFGSRYIGQTGRNVFERYDKHLRAYDKAKHQKSEFAKHLLEGHSFKSIQLPSEDEWIS